MKRQDFLKIIAAGVLCALGAQTAPAQVRTERYDLSAMEDDAITYTLPETRLYLAFSIEETRETPGDFALYAGRYLGTSEVVMAKARTFVLKGIEAGTYGVPSDTLRFTTRFGRRNSATNVTLTQDGILLAVNAPAVTLPELPASKTSVLGDRDPFRALSSMPREYVQATSLAKKAQIAADEIYRLRDSRTAVISGESEQPFPDGEAMKVAIGGLDEAERALTERFTGVRQSALSTVVLKGFRPEEGEQIVARFSEQYGLLDKDDLRGEPVYLRVTVLEAAPKLEERDLRKKERQLSRGVVYTMPGRILAELSFEGTVLAKEEFAVAQYGTLEALEAVLFTDRDKVTEILLDPATGGVRQVLSK